MIDQDTIRKAVELADGFQMSGDDCFSLPTGKRLIRLYDCPQWAKDTIAAQLVRQYLKARHPTNPPNQYSGWHSDPMKTIKSIVDNSGGDAQTTDFPAKYTVFWPGQTVRCCQTHFDGLMRVNSAMGGAPVDYRKEDGDQCGNCINEAKDDSGRTKRS